LLIYSAIKKDENDRRLCNSFSDDWHRQADLFLTFSCFTRFTDYILFLSLVKLKITLPSRPDYFFILSNLNNHGHRGGINI